MVDTDVPLDEIVLAYRKLRDVMQETEAAHKEAMADLREQLDLLSSKMLEVCKEQNADSIRTPAGTITRKITARYWTSDWESMYEFIREHDAPFLLEQRIHNSSMRQFLEDNPDIMPAGLQADRKFTVQVRKPTSK